MSASREKKKRFEERSDGTEKRQVRAKADAGAKKRKKIITTAAVVVVVALVLVGVIFNSNLFYTGVPALKVGNTGYTAADFNYEYYNTYYNTYSSMADMYGSYASMFLDPSTPLDEQNYSDTMTWADYFEDQAFTQLQQMTILNDMADKEGWTLSSEQLREIDANIEGLKTAAAGNNYPDYRAYIRALYGKGITEKRLRTLLEKSYRATYYSQYLSEKWMDSYSEEQLSEYYDSVRSEYDLLSYMTYFVDGSVPEGSELDADAAMAQASDTANEIASARDQAAFAAAVYNFAPEESRETYADEDACLRRLVSPASITNSEWSSWLTDAARAAGDTTVVPSSTGYQVLLFLERNGNEYKLANFRGITINVATDEETGEITDETRQAAQATVDEILAAFNADPTEENFASLADLYDTSGEAGAGGLYQNVVMGQMASEAVEAYVFGEDTVPGTVETFYEDGRYYVTYPLESGEQYNLFIAKNRMAEEQYNSVIEAAKADYPVDTKFAFRFTKKNR